MVAGRSSLITFETEMPVPEATRSNSQGRGQCESKLQSASTETVTPLACFLSDALCPLPLPSQSTPRERVRDVLELARDIDLLGALADTVLARLAHLLRAAT